MDLNLTLDTLGTYSWLVIPFGLFLGLFGYRMYKVSLFIVGLYLGIVLGLLIGDVLENARIGFILGIVLGLTFGIATQFLLKFSFFIAGMVGAYMLASNILPETSLALSPEEILLWSGVAALVGGLLTVILHKILILFFTSVIGTYLIYSKTIDLFPSDTAEWSWIPYVALLFVFIVVQLSFRKNHPHSAKHRRA